LLGLISLWGAVNLLFSISWGTELIAGRIEKRLGLPCELESATWTPWGGVVVKDFVVTPEENSGFSGEILRVDTVKIDLSWFSLMQRKKRFERLEIAGVTGEMSLELLKSLLKKNVITEEPKLLEKENVPEETSDAPPSETPPGKEKKDRERVTEEDKETELPDLPVEPVDNFEGVIVFRDVNLALTSLKYPALTMSVENLEGELPIWGGERENQVAFSALRVGEWGAGEMEVPVVWKGTSLEVDQHVLKIAGLDLRVTLILRIARGLPFGIQVEAPDQQIDFSPIFGSEKSPVSIEKLAFKGMMQGFLTMPRSFSGFGKAGFAGMKIRDRRDASVIEFYRGYGEARVDRAGLIVPIARMIGDEEAILWNGFVTSNGEAAAIVRLVGSPERSEAYEKRVRRTSKKWTLDFKPLVTRDRLYRDLRMEYLGKGLTVDLGENQSRVLLLPAIRTILTASSNSPNLVQ